MPMRFACAYWNPSRARSSRVLLLLMNDNTMKKRNCSLVHCCLYRIFLCEESVGHLLTILTSQLVCSHFFVLLTDRKIWLFSVSIKGFWQLLLSDLQLPVLCCVCGSVDLLRETSGFVTLIRFNILTLCKLI